MRRKNDAPTGMHKQGTTRRDFLKLSAVAAASVGTGALSKSLADPRPSPQIGGRGNPMPGRIVIYRDPLMAGHEWPLNRDRIEQVVHHGVRMLTSTGDIGAAFQSLFPGLHSGSTFAIKVNCIGPTDTRWETVRGIVSGLSQMCDGTYNVSQVTIYDRHNLHYHGYDEGEFTFNDNYPLISHTANCGSYQVYGGYRLSDYLVNCNYVINVPALKSHNDGNNQITVAFKNHYGSCCPSSLCGNITGMLTVNSDSYIKDKTCLTVTCGLRGTYNGGPGEQPQIWNTFPEGAPNTLMFTTDPVTNEYWARDTINAERASHGWGPKPCPWVEEATGEPWDLGVSNPSEMTVVYPTDVPDEGTPFARATLLAPNVPNPFAEQTTLRFRLGAPGPARLVIVDASGRLVRKLTDRAYPEGYSEVRWDGCGRRGERLPNGVYFAQLKADGGSQTRTVLLAR